MNNEEKQISFVLIGNAWQNRPVHVQSLSGRRITLCGHLYNYSWSKSKIPTANFCSRCEKSLNKMGYRVEVQGILKSKEVEQ